MTKLLNRDRDTLLAAILADVPKEDYAGRATAIVQEAALALCPVPVRLMWRDPELRPWLEKTYIYLPGYHGLPTVAVPAPEYYEDRKEYERKVMLDPKVQELIAAHDEQAKRIAGITNELRANLEACPTREVFRKRFPDLAGYLPELVKDTPAAMLPSTTALMDHLKAAGLPLPKELDTAA